jgi:hypothetical protein
MTAKRSCCESICMPLARRATAPLLQSASHEHHGDWKRIDELRQELRSLLLMKVDELGTPLLAPRTIDIRGRAANLASTTTTTERPGAEDLALEASRSAC